MTRAQRDRKRAAADRHRRRQNARRREAIATAEAAAGNSHRKFEKLMEEAGYRQKGQGGWQRAPKEAAAAA